MPCYFFGNSNLLEHAVISQMKCQISLSISTIISIQIRSTNFKFKNVSKSN